MTRSPANDVDAFLSRHVLPPPGKTAEDVKARILRWIDIANDPTLATQDHSPQNIADLRRKARQNVRRLVQKHPDAAAQIDALQRAEVSQ